MENNLENGIDWNLYANLKSFKSDEQNIYKTAINIRNLFEDKKIFEDMERNRKFESIIESEQLKLERGE